MKYTGYVIIAIHMKNRTEDMITEYLLYIVITIVTIRKWKILSFDSCHIISDRMFF